MAEYRMFTDPAGQPSHRPDPAFLVHADGERTVAQVDGPVVRVLRFDAHGNVLGHVHVHTASTAGELTTVMGTAAASVLPLPGTAQLRATAGSVTLVVRTHPDDVLICRLVYAPGHGYRLLRRTRIRP
ncbi:hypothetical protein GCM10007388_26200 [Pseudoduganella plicata]|uniref:Uncharacterized protein n=2 Tax=Pseudoduganella plicata TaxID=321984 RepID=A0AA87Y5C8_9BURK|nr:hypothetical protein GCM10007388_26200 [Pseudoduganella plicata]